MRDASEARRDPAGLFAGSGVARPFAYLWAAPVTAVGALWALAAVLTGGRGRWRAGVLEVQGGVARVLLARALGGAAEALTLGHVVLARDAATHDRWRGHERVHVAQVERWGILFPFAYLTAGLVARLRGGHAYRDNAFERPAFAAERAVVTLHPPFGERAAMVIPFDHTIDLPQDPATVFAFLDDFSLTPQWLAPCVRLESLGGGPHAVGDALLYAHDQAGRVSEMTGEITAHDPGHRLAFRFRDSSFDLTIEFRLAPHDGGTTLTHAIEITPLSMMTRLVAPMIRGALPRQTITAMEQIRTMLGARV